VATLKEGLQSFFEVTGTQDVDAALNVVNAWRDQAQHAVSREELNTANGQIQQFCEALGVQDFDAALARVGELKTQLSNIWGVFGATDQAGAIAAIDKMRGELTAANNRVAELTASQANFDVRLAEGINQGVITRAASAGIPEPVKKDIKQITAVTGENILTRDQFNAMPPRQRTDFINKGGKITD
jgi:hypothetical protein